MNDSFINNQEINEFVVANNNNTNSSIFKYNEEKNSQEEIATNDKQEVKEVSFRWIILVSFCLLNFSNGMQWVTYAAIADNFRKFKEITEFQVDLYSLCYMIIYPFVNFPSSYIIDSKSMRFGLVFAAILTISASILKIFTFHSLIIAIVGQICAAIAQPFILNSPGKLSTTWFRQEVRVLITSIAALFNTIGTIFGFILPSLLFDEKYEIDSFSNSLYKYLIIESIIAFIFCLPTIIFMKNKPHIPPSLSEKDHKHVSFKESLSLLIKNWNFIFLMISFTFIIGYLNLYGTKINSIFAKYNKISTNKISQIAGIANVFGILGAIIISILVDKLKKYKITFIILALLATIFQILITIFAEIINGETNSFISILICFSAVQFCIIPIFTISFDLVIELTYPVGESISGGIIMSMTQISGIIAIMSVDYIVTHYKSNLYIPNAICTGMLVIAFISLFFIKGSILYKKENLIRLKKDISQQRDNVNEKS